MVPDEERIRGGEEMGPFCFYSKHFLLAHTAIRLGFGGHKELHLSNIHYLVKIIPVLRNIMPNPTMLKEVYLKLKIELLDLT